MARPEVRRDVEIGTDLGLVPSAFDGLADDDKALLRAEWHARKGVCSQHGGPLDECEHDTWFPQRSVCVPAMELAAAEWLYDEVHDGWAFHDGTFKRWSKDRNARYPYHYRDGVTLWVARDDANPDDDFLTPLRHREG